MCVGNLSLICFYFKQTFEIPDVAQNVDVVCM